jgi:hypothetical protein
VGTVAILWLDYPSEAGVNEDTDNTQHECSPSSQCGEKVSGDALAAAPLQKLEMNRGSQEEVYHEMYQHGWTAVRLCHWRGK